MNNTEKHSNELKEKILTDPNIILEDSDLMEALINAQNKLYGDNIVDLRGAAMSQLEKRLERVENNHNDVIALAYENLAGASQIQRAILRLLETNDFPSFIKILSKELCRIFEKIICHLPFYTHDAAKCLVGYILCIFSFIEYDLQMPITNI